MTQHRKTERAPKAPPRFNHERLHAVLKDGTWHDIQRLHEHGIGWPMQAKYRLVHSHGFAIETRRHPLPPHQWQYRISK